MMGMAMSTLDIPVVKTSSSILAFSKDDVAMLPQSACIHCGKCVAACPEILVPQMMCKSIKTNMKDSLTSAVWSVWSAEAAPLYVLPKFRLPRCLSSVRLRSGKFSLVNKEGNKNV